MKIVADENMPALDETFATGNELVRLNGRQIGPDDVKDADVLLVRSITRVDADLLKGSQVQFVGSATIGIDHLDTQWLDTNGIHWANAPGCNADTAAQFTLAMMMLACKRLDRDFLQQTVGVIGRGNVGSRLVKLLQSMGMSVVACDPPLHDAGQIDLVSMRDACAQNMVSIHVPLIQDGPHPTRHLFDQNRLSQLASGTLLVNAARGGVVDADALLDELESGRLHAALDVWPNEPTIEQRLLKATVVATPHVAGSSVQGKRNGTLMIYQSFCQTFPGQATLLRHQSQTARIAETLSFSPDITFSDALMQLVQSSCPIQRDDQMLRSLADTRSVDDLAAEGSSSEKPSVQIDILRSQYPRRHEFSSLAFHGTNRAIADALNRLGFLNA